MLATALRGPRDIRLEDRRSAQATLAAALLGFFVITLDAVVVNVALPTIAREFHAGVTGLQWVVDGYTLLFAALLLSAGALSDRIGARRAFGAGLVVFVLASVACGLAPSLGLLVGARFLQGVGAAVMMPTSMALIRQAYADPAARGRAVAVWAMGGAVASTSGPVLGGWLTLLSWRWIFFINVPVGLVTLAFLARAHASPRRAAPLDGWGQLTAVVAMGALTYGAIEAGGAGLAAPSVLAALGVAAAALATFVATQRRGAHPMVPPSLFQSPNARIAMAVGFTFMVGYFGLPFVISLYLQQRGLTAFQAGSAFLPMMLVGLVVAPPVAAVLLNSVPASLAGTASGVFNTSRQVGGALAVAVFGALLARSTTFMAGARASLLLAAGIALATALVGLRLRPPHDPG